MLQTQFSPIEACLSHAPTPLFQIDALSLRLIWSDIELLKATYHLYAHEVCHYLELFVYKTYTDAAGLPIHSIVEDF